MSIFKALIMREILDGQNGYIRVPVILAGITILLLLLSIIGFGNSLEIDGVRHEGISNLGDALNVAKEREPAELPAGVTLGYWGATSLPWVAFPFVVFFSLLGSLYEERRDRSILFWKSMPTADWQEVLAKFFVPVFIVPLIFLAVVIAAQIIVAFLLSIIVLFQGGPLLELWPLWLMIKTWFAGLSMYYIHAFWVLPMLAWVSLVSAYASRMPFLWAILAPGIVIAIEGILFETGRIASWIGIHLGGWFDPAFSNYGSTHVDGPRDILTFFVGGPQWHALTYSLGSLHFWAGVVIAVGFLFGAIELRKRAL